MHPSRRHALAALLVVSCGWLVLNVSAAPAGSPQASKATAASKKAVSLKTPAMPEAPAKISGCDAGKDYCIGVEDELTISVWHEPELSAAVVVRPDGCITLPLLNDVPVVGLTTAELQVLLTNKLKGLITEPQVTVVVRGIRSRKVYLLGQVGRPGAFPLNSDKTVLQLIAESGGITAFAKKNSIYVLRERSGQRVRLKFDYKKAVSTGSNKYDLVLLPGDMVVVP